jgi:hypothetical protein
MVIDIEDLYFGVEDIYNLFHLLVGGEVAVVDDDSVVGLTQR